MRYTITNCSVVDGLSNPVQHNMDVEISENTITTVSNHVPTEAHTRESDTHILIDGTDKTLMPGLIDAHCHMTYGESLGQESQDIYTSVESRSLRSAWNVQKVLANGVTGISDPGGSFYIGVAIRDAIRAGRLTGPRMTTSGRYITTSNGLVEFYPEPASRGIMDRMGSGIGHNCNTLDEMIDATRRQIRAGVDYIKIADSSYGQFQAFRYEELKTLADLAHQMNTSITIHARGDKEMNAAVRAGFDWVHHGNYMSEETADLIAEKDILLIPSLALLHNWSEHGSLMGAPPHISEANKRMLDRTRVSMALARERGVRFGLGTDSGFAMTPYGEFHAKELELLMDYCGLSALEAIQAGTSNVAITLGLDGKTGIIQEGKLADLLLVDGNPAIDITLLQDPDNLVEIFRDGERLTLNPAMESWPHDDQQDFAKTRLSRKLLTAETAPTRTT